MARNASPRKAGTGSRRTTPTGRPSASRSASKAGKTSGAGQASKSSRSSKSSKSSKAPAARARRGSIPSPADLPGAGKREYLLMTRAVLALLPAKAPGLTFGALTDRVREATSRKDFPGETYRMWAKQVLLDLEANGAAVRGGGTTPAWWRA